MTEQQEAALRQALAFVEFCWREVEMNDYAQEKREETETALMAALEQPARYATTIGEGNLSATGLEVRWPEQPAQHDRVPYIIEMLGHCPECGAKAHHFTRPQAREWVGLTDEEVMNFVRAVWPRNATPVAYTRAIEAKLREKNA